MLDRTVDRRDDVLRAGAEDQLQPLLQDQADAPGGKYGVERPPVEVLDDPAFEQEPEQTADDGREQERQPVASAKVIDDGEREGADSDEFPMRHVDDVHQPEDDGKPEAHQHQDADQREDIEEDR